MLLQHDDSTINIVLVLLLLLFHSPAPAAGVRGFLPRKIFQI